MKKLLGLLLLGITTSSFCVIEEIAYSSANTTRLVSISDDQSFYKCCKKVTKKLNKNQSHLMLASFGSELWKITLRKDYLGYLSMSVMPGCSLDLYNSIAPENGLPYLYPVGYPTSNGQFEECFVENEYAVQKYFCLIGSLCQAAHKAGITLVSFGLGSGYPVLHEEDCSSHKEILLSCHDKNMVNIWYQRRLIELGFMPLSNDEPGDLSRPHTAKKEIILIKTLF